MVVPRYSESNSRLSCEITHTILTRAENPTRWRKSNLSIGNSRCGGGNLSIGFGGGGS